MGARRVLLFRAAETDMGLAVDHHRAVGGFRLCHGAVDILGVVAVAMQHGPAGGAEPLPLVGDVGHADLAVDGNVVVVPQHDQLRQPLHPGKADRLMADAFHQAAVTGDDPGVVIDHLLAKARAQAFLGDGEADGIGDALTQRAGRRLDPLGVAIFRVAGGLGAPLAEIADLFQRHVLVAGEVKQRVKQHRPVTGGQDEAVAVGPVRRGGVEFQVLGEEDGRDIGHPHRHAGVAGIGGLDGVHGKRADRGGLRPVFGMLVTQRRNVHRGSFLRCLGWRGDSSNRGKIKRTG